MRNQIRKFDRFGSFFPSVVNNYLNDDLFNNFFEGDLPAVNINETEKAFNIELSVPGYNKEDINIEIEKNLLKISAQNEIKKEGEGLYLQPIDEFAGLSLVSNL